MNSATFKVMQQRMIFVGSREKYKVPYNSKHDFLVWTIAEHPLHLLHFLSYAPHLQTL